MRYTLQSPQHSERAHTKAEARGGGVYIEFSRRQKDADQAEGLA